MINSIKNQWYLLQLENYDLSRFLRLIISGVGFKIKKTRQTLVYTAKLKLVITVSLLLQLLVAWALSGNWLIFLIWLIIFFLVHFIFLVAAVVLVWPFDYLTKQVIISRAKRKIASYKKLKVIGITGSFGKTTMKESLATVLAEKFKILKTPENINTPLGISRLILNNLTVQIEIFIVEMGAYQKDDIHALCEITRPQIAILTGINEAHLERFGSIENTVAAKFEIVVNSKPDALVVLNQDSPLIKQNYERFVADRKVAWYSSDKPELENVQTKLLGSYAIGIINAIATVAKELAETPEQIRTGLGKIQAIPHRLELVQSANGVTVIDDSYNGNPDGVAEAIKVLGRFTDKRKVYLTPGLVEMGTRNQMVHMEIGRKLAPVADLVILINNSATPFIREGLLQEGFSPDKIISFESAPEAHENLKNILQPGDAILFQNDWPENYV